MKNIHQAVKNIHQVAARVGLIAENAHDFGRAHVMEDELYRAVLEAIADGVAKDPAEWARRALMSQKLEFNRVCA